MPRHTLLTMKPDAHHILNGCPYWYFGTGGAGIETLPVGTKFGVVYSPAPSIHSESARRWRYVVFQVVITVIRGSHDRMYSQVSQRSLTSDEIAHFEGMR